MFKRSSNFLIGLSTGRIALLGLAAALIGSLLNPAAFAASPLPPYSAEALGKLAKAVFEATIDQATAEHLLRTRNVDLSVNLKVFGHTSKLLRDLKFSEEAILKAEEMVHNALRASPPIVQAPDTARLQGDLLQDFGEPSARRQFGTNLMTAATNVQAASRHISEHGNQSSLLGTNAPAFGTNLFALGTGLEAAGIKLTQDRGAFLPHAELHFGLVTLNPFRVTVDPGTNGPRAFMEQDDKSARLLVEFTYNNRWAWNMPEPTEVQRVFTKPMGRFRGWDFQGRISFSFLDGDGDGASILGAGDLYSEFSVGKHLVRWATENQAHSVNMETSYGAATDRSSLDLHARILHGLSYSAGFDNPFFGSSDHHRRILFTTRMGIAWFDVPRFLNSDTNEVAIRRGVPDFQLSFGYALETEFFYPLSATSALTAGGRVYGCSDPNPWTIWVGYTKSVGQIVSAARSLLPGGSFGEK
jgi:hypothetical protein